MIHGEGLGDEMKWFLTDSLKFSEVKRRSLKAKLFKPCERKLDLSQMTDKAATNVTHTLNVLVLTYIFSKNMDVSQSNLFFYETGSVHVKIWAQKVLTANVFRWTQHCGECYV